MHADAATLRTSNRRDPSGCFQVHVRAAAPTQKCIVRGDSLWVYVSHSGTSRIRRTQRRANDAELASRQGDRFGDVRLVLLWRELDRQESHRRS
jgi:hypothetical protein